MNFFYWAMLLQMIVAPIVKMILKMLGIGIVTYFGINMIISEAKDYVLSNMGNVGQSIQMVLGLAKIDVAINIYFAAITTRLILVGMDKVTGHIKKVGHTGTFEA